jgi:hypothetical protein
LIAKEVGEKGVGGWTARAALGGEELDEDGGSAWNLLGNR